MSEKPLHNVIICCTSVTQEERSSIMRKALEMGAVAQADLTSDVTHLIVARLQTEKYRFAARHRTDLKLMNVDWIPAIHAIWITGRDVNLPWSEDKYRLPIFYGLRVCVTNLEVELRTQIEQIVTQHGAHYSGDLTKENTHLIAGSASGKKWEAVIAWQCDISVVGVEWVYESIKRGASLDEKFFRLELSPEVRGQTSWYPPKAVPKPDILDDTPSPDTAKRKRPLAASAARKRLSKRASTLATDGLWIEILKREDTENEVDLPQVPEEVERHGKEGGLGASDLNLLPDELTRGIFDGRSFYVTSFAAREEAIVQSTLQSNGGMLVAHVSLADLIVVPQTGSPPRLDHGEVPMVTEFWLERCLSLHRFEDPSHHFLSTPFHCTLPIPRMEQVSICTSGFSAVESMHIEKLVKKVGAIYCDTLTKGRSILLAATRECRKYNLAKDNGTRVVKLEWLWECIRRDKMVGVMDYALDGVIGSQCRIDGQVALRQRRRHLLQDVVCYIHGSMETTAPLHKMASEMGARIAALNADSGITHVIADNSYTRGKHAKNVACVTAAWLKESFVLLSRQPETPYLITSTHINDENVPPEDASTPQNSLAVSDKPDSNKRLATEMHAIRKRMTVATSRRSPRKILGRAVTLPHVDNASMMMQTNEEESLDDTGACIAAATAAAATGRHKAALQHSSTQASGVTYSDPEVVEKQRELMVKLGAVERSASSSSSSFSHEQQPGSRGSMRAVGLDTTRKLRR